MSPVSLAMVPPPHIAIPGYAYPPVRGPFPSIEPQLVKSGSETIMHAFGPPVQGAKNIINACRECKVRRLNSSADVVFDGSQNILNGDESFTCPEKDMLVELKFQAEELIRLANNIDDLLTCVLRSSNIFGPGDTQFVPLLVNLAKSGLAKFITRSCENMSELLQDQLLLFNT
ncbi:hypothetical protein CRYUN_Cryun25bG0049800 [Craigia yunnanensis]